jgi:hypothetical protein
MKKGVVSPTDGKYGTYVKCRAHPVSRKKVVPDG